MAAERALEHVHEVAGPWEADSQGEGAEARLPLSPTCGILSKERREHPPAEPHVNEGQERPHEAHTPSEAAPRHALLVIPVPLDELEGGRRCSERPGARCNKVDRCA